MQKFEIFSPKELAPICQLITQDYPKTIVLQGDLGAGKTTFVKNFIAQWENDLIISSPTFTLMNIYHVNNLTITHFDLYRLSDASEALELGFDEAILECDFAFIEWAERAWEIIPKPYTLLKIQHGTHETHRILQLSIIAK